MISVKATHMRKGIIWAYRDGIYPGGEGMRGRGRESMGAGAGSWRLTVSSTWEWRGKPVSPQNLPPVKSAIRSIESQTLPVT